MLAGQAGRPSIREALSTAEQIVGVELVETVMGSPELSGGGAGVGLADEMTVKAMTKERGGHASDQLIFFMGTKMPAGEGDLSP